MQQPKSTRINHPIAYYLLLLQCATSRPGRPSHARDRKRQRMTIGRRTRRVGHGRVPLLDPAAVQINSRIGNGRAASTLSMPKGRVLCACAIEEGILPHSSACALLPTALSCILLSPSSDDGEDRLIHALTELILLTKPTISQPIFCRSLDVPILLARDNMSAIASSHMRMNLLHAVLSMGKGLLCERGLVPKGRYLQWHTRWVPKMTLKKGRALWRLPLIFIKVTFWINSKCRIYTTFKLWHKGTATRLGAKLWQCSLESVL
jgi:hypothetical protein